MATTVFEKIKLLAGTRSESYPLRGKELAHLPCIENAFLLIEDEHIVAYGSMNEWKGTADEVIHAAGKIILPAWCDSHTHLVFAGSRESEFIDKLKGLSYEEIAGRGGGILNSAKRLNETSEDELLRQAALRLDEVSGMGTASIEIKSGYGLTIESELKMLRVIKKLKERSRLHIKSTFLGAHAYPIPFRHNHEGCIQQIVNEMLPAVAREDLADYVDVFCETGFFSPLETQTICKAARQYGLKPKLHVNQLNSIGGIDAGIQMNALSLDHLENLTEPDIEMLATNPVISTLLPTASFFLRMNYPPARTLIDKGAAVALASDYNPGSSPSGNMNLVVSLACIQMKMMPEEAINAATLNGAYAMELGNETGSITVGKSADIIMTKPVPSLNYLPYAFGHNHIEQVMIRGEMIR